MSKNRKRLIIVGLLAMAMLIVGWWVVHRTLGSGNSIYVKNDTGRWLFRVIVRTAMQEDRFYLVWPGATRLAESFPSGTPMFVEIDTVGWRYKTSATCMNSRDPKSELELNEAYYVQVSLQADGRCISR